MYEEARSCWNSHEYGLAASGRVKVAEMSVSACRVTLHLLSAVSMHVSHSGNMASARTAAGFP